MVVRLLETPKKAPLEKAIQSKIMKYLRNFEKFSGDVITKGLYGGNGIADIVGCYDGRFVGFEVKRFENIEPTPIQKLWLAEKKRAGGIVGYGASIETLKTVFEIFEITLDNEPTKS